MAQETEWKELPEGAREDDKQWMKVRQAAHEADVSLVWIYRLSYQEPSPFITKTVPRGRHQQELRIWRPSFERWMKSRRAGDSDDWGRQLVSAPRLVS